MIYTKSAQVSQNLYVSQPCLLSSSGIAGVSLCIIKVSEFRTQLLNGVIMGSGVDDC
jgi:hypothetical protein